MFITASRMIPSVLVEDKTRAQTNARAGWNARRYGVTVGFLSDSDRELLHGIEQDRILAVANDNARWGFDQPHEIGDTDFGDYASVYYDCAAGQYDYDTSVS